MSDATPYSVPKEPGRWRAITLAAVVHAALFALLWFGVRWQNETPVAVEAEVWSPQPREAAPRPQPEPEPKPEIKPEPKPVIKETPKPRVIEPPVVKPDIALEQEKKRKLQEEKTRLEQERERQEKLAEQKAAKQEKLAEQKAEEKAKQKRIEQAEAETARKKTEADEAKKIAVEKKRKQQIEADTKIVEQRRQENLARITSQAGGVGDAPKAQGGRADPSYTQRLSAKIKSNTTYNMPPDLENNPAVEYTVELLPDGSVRSIKKLRPSGLFGFDEAVERAIRRSEPYPADKSGTVPSSFTFSHKPKDNQ